MNRVKQGLLVVTALLIAVWFWLFADDRPMFYGLMIWILAVFIGLRYDYVRRGKALQQAHPDQQIFMQSISLSFFRVMPLAFILIKEELYLFSSILFFILVMYQLYDEKFLWIDNHQIILQDRKNQEVIEWADVIHLKSDPSQIIIQSKNSKISILVSQWRHAKLIRESIQPMQEQYKPQILDRLKASTSSFLNHEVQSDKKKIKWIGMMFLIMVGLSLLSFFFSKDAIHQFSQLMMIACLFAFPFFWIRQRTNKKFSEHPVDGMVFLINSDLIHFFPVMIFLVLGVPAFFLLDKQVLLLILIFVTLWTGLSFWYIDFFSKKLVLSKHGIIYLKRQNQKMISWDQITSYDFTEQGVFLFYKNDEGRVEQYSITFLEWINSDLLAREIVHYLRLHQIQTSEEKLAHQLTKPS